MHVMHTSRGPLLVSKNGRVLGGPIHGLGATPLENCLNACPRMKDPIWGTDQGVDPSCQLKCNQITPPVPVPPVPGTEPGDPNRPPTPFPPNVKDASQCPAGTVFAFGQCVANPVTGGGACQEGWSLVAGQCVPPIGGGGDPNKRTPPQTGCPAGQTGFPPLCMPIGDGGGEQPQQTCPQGYQGTPPICLPIPGGNQQSQCPQGQTGTPPVCLPIGGGNGQPNGGCPDGQFGVAPMCVPTGLTQPQPNDPQCPAGQKYFPYFGCQNIGIGGQNGAPPVLPTPPITSDGCPAGAFKFPIIGCTGASGPVPPIANCPDGTVPVGGKCPGGKPPNPINSICPDGSYPVNGKCAGGVPSFTCYDNSIPINGRCPNGQTPIPVAPTKSSWVLPVVIGVGVVAVGGVAYLMLKKKKPQTASASATPVTAAANRRRRRY